MVNLPGSLGIEILPDERRLLVNGEPVPVGARAFDLLMCLLKHRDRVVTKEELLQTVWPGVVVEESNLTVHVAALRKLLGAQAIATIAGRGYRFVAPAGAVAGAPVLAARSAPEPARPDGADKPSLAVLPFANLSGDAAQDYFVDGVVDDLTNALSRIRRFFVVARSSSFTYKGRVVDVPQVGRELGVRYVLEGSLRLSGDRLRIGVQLVETAAGRHVWTQRFDGRRSDIFDLQDQITAQVVAAIEPQLVLAEVERARTKPTTNLQAYDLCLLALPLVLTFGTQDQVERAIPLLQRAVEIDPAYSYAKALCAWAHAFAFANLWIPRTRAEAALHLAHEAYVEHRDDPATLAYAGHTLAYIGHRHAEGLHALDTALALNPSSMTALRSAGWVRCYVGDYAIAIQHLQHAMALNPLDPEIAYVLCGLAYAHLGAGDAEKAVDLARRAVAAQPASMPAQSALLWSLGAAGRWDEARAFLPHYLARRPGYRYGPWAARNPWTDPRFRTLVVGDFDKLGVPA